MGKNIVCKGYSWRVRAFEPIHNNSCPYHTCDTCVKCMSGDCVWVPNGNNRGCYNINNIPEPFLSFRNQSLIRTSSQCNDCRIHTDLEDRWGRCQGCPSTQKRTVECISQVDLRTVDEDHCDADKKPN